MNFSSAMQYLQAGKCAKTTAMNGYIKRIDYVKSSFESQPAEGAAGRVAYDALNRAEGAADAVREIVFVENGSYPDGDSRRQYAFRYEDGGSNAGWSYAGARDSDATEFTGGGANPAPAFSAAGTYAVGDFVTYGGTRYRCTAAVSEAGAWTGDTNWTADPGSPFILDATLFNLVANSQDWSTFSTSEVEAAAVSDARW